MSRTTSDLGDGNIRGTMSNGNTIIAGSNLAVGDVNKTGQA